MTSPRSCDLLVRGARAVLTMDPGGPGPVAPEAVEGLPVVPGGAVAVGGGRILAVGPEGEFRAAWRPRETLDARGGLVVPGLVDAHTHPAFVRGRAEEFDWRNQGTDYLEIARRGGGILATVRAVREASEEELTAAVVAHFRRMLRHGTTTCEAKSGYGLTPEDEARSLRAIRAAAVATGMNVAPTFLGAHTIPAEHREDPERYLEVLCQEALPAVAEAGLARAADVFVEEGAFSVDMARRYLERARELGLALRVHAEQFHCLGGAALAAELGAESADHLEAVDETGIAALAAAGTFAGLLPAVPHFLRQPGNAPARRLLEAGVPWFVATDFNPGSCYMPSLVEAVHFARVRLGLSALEALAGITVNAAASLGLGERKGRIAVGCDADLVVLDLADHLHVGYALGENPVRGVVAGGQILAPVSGGGAP